MYDTFRNRNGGFKCGKGGKEVGTDVAWRGGRNRMMLPQ